MSNSFFNFTIYPISNEETILESNNYKKLLIVSSSEINDTDTKTFLKKILSAIQLNLDEDASLLVLASDDIVQLSKVRQQTAFEKCLIFGITPQQLGLNIDIQLYSMLEISGISFIFANNLTQISESKALKGNLWKVLQQAFL